MKTCKLDKELISAVMDHIDNDTFTQEEKELVREALQEWSKITEL